MYIYYKSIYDIIVTTYAQTTDAQLFLYNVGYAFWWWPIMEERCEDQVFTYS
jgi:hypothetical protein